MSSSEALADLVQELQSFTIENYVDLTVFTVVMYDWILTFPDEVRIMWKRPLTGSKLLFFLNRYIFIAYYVTIIMSDQNSGANRRCSSLGILNNLFIVLHNLVVSVFQILRVYAISGRRKRYAFLIGALQVFPFCFGIYIWAISAFLPLPPPLQGCDGSFSMSNHAYNILTITQRVCLIVGDAIVVVVTVHHTYGTVKASREANLRSTFSSTVLNAGILYFSVMLAINTVDFIVNLTINNNYLDDFPALFDYLLISHFLLNLQEISTVTTDGSNPSRPSFVRSSQDQVSSIRFADLVIGNLGESLRDGSRDYDEDNDADDDGMVTNGDIEMSPLPHKDEEDPVRAALPGSEDIWEENSVAGPSRLPLDVLHNRNTSTGRSPGSEMQV